MPAAPPPPGRRSRLAFVSVAAAAALASVSPRPARAGGAVLTPAGAPEPPSMSVHVAVAATPYGTTRWMRVAAGTSSPVLWLVPVRPGAALDLAPEAWLDALEAATTPRLVPPALAPSTCAPATGSLTLPWAPAHASARAPTRLELLTDEASARAFVAARGFAVPEPASARLRGLAAAGWQLVALEIPGGATRTGSRTLRVSDDGDPVLPLSLTGGALAPVDVTAFVLGPATAAVPGGTILDAPLRWGPSTTLAFAAAREEATSGGALLREASGREALFRGYDVPGGAPVPSVVSGYLGACADDVERAALSGGTVGRRCASGALGRVPGGTACAPVSGDIAPAAFACGADDDLALAMAGQRPTELVLTRFVGRIPAYATGRDVPIALADLAARPPVYEAVSYDCSAGRPATGGGSLAPPAPPSSPAGEDGASSTRSDGCGGSAVVVVPDEEPAQDGTYDSCGGGPTTGWPTGGDEDTSGDSDDDTGWDTGDDDTGWDTGDDDTGWDTSDDDTGWDTSDDLEMHTRVHRKSGAPKTARLHVPARHPKQDRGGSPLSRVAVLAVALVLPLRRRLRLHAERADELRS